MLVLCCILILTYISAVGRGSDMSQLAQSNNLFAFKLYQSLQGKNANFVYSPYSVYLALGMTYAGARGTTAKEMAKVLHFLLFRSRAQLYATFQGLTQELVSQNDVRLKLHIVCALWAQINHMFLPGFTSILKDNYGVELGRVDFRKQPEAARRTINQWAVEETAGKIKELVPRNGITTTTRLILTNAVYFNAQWLYPFDGGQTADGVFRLWDGQTVSVPMMKREAQLGYAAGNGWKAVEIPYEGEGITMVLILPDYGRFKEVQALLSAGWVDKVVAEFHEKEVCLAMPKFMNRASLKLKAILVRLGMESPFNPTNADFSGMDGARDLFLDEVYHETFISVDEAGTEAAAASAVMVAIKSSPLSRPCIKIRVDRPFMFFIQDEKSGVILFLGQILDPR